ncbi:hypothetical protein FHR95_000849 [Halomonas fontilapidosi]|uniref:Uncharacterized protein n=1 Tax=Halomonas fontilapidosi TaxID=616675 RepID=A0A7W5DIP8_9GAMM|nr:hypothetical protein [Halomonas fontilapidosi]MBB3183308.1 hypothetical protein [Halomonas fontilapidosi]
MCEDHKRVTFEVYTRQHEFYAAQTATALQFPIKLVLSLNAAVMAASLLFVREAVQAGDPTQFVRLPMVLFALGVICVLFASWFQWQLYSKIMHRKRKVLEDAIAAIDWVQAVHPFVNEPERYGKTWYHGLCYTFVVASFVFFLLGVFTLARAL